MWTSLRLTVIHAEYKAEQACRLPPYKGTTLRGALGFALKASACFKSPAACRGCDAIDRCAYGAMFEGADPRLPVRDGNGAPGHTWPMPYLLTPPLERRGEFQAGETITMSLTLVGSGRAWLPWVVDALAQMGPRGLGWGRHPWTLVRLAAEPRPGERADIALTGGIERLRIPEMDAQAMLDAFPVRDSATLRFLTPVDLRHERRRVRPDDGPIVVSRLVRRLGDLAERYCGWNKTGFDFAALIGDARQIHCEDRGLQERTWERFSSEAMERHPLSGYVGDVVLTGIPPLLWPYLVVGQWVHLGKETSFGLGKYALEPATATPAVRAPSSLSPARSPRPGGRSRFVPARTSPIPRVQRLAKTQRPPQEETNAR